MNVGWWRLSGCRYALCMLSCEWSDWGNGFWWGITNKWCWLTVFDWTLKWYLKADSVFQLNNRHSVVDPQCSTTLQHQFCFTVFIFFYCTRFSHSLILYYTLFERCAWQWWCHLNFFFLICVFGEDDGTPLQYWMEEPGRLQSMGSRRVRHDWATSLWLFTFMHWRRKWQPTPVFLPGEF